METKNVSPTIPLECCCCGNGTIGRQWWNRDTGYGLCQDCIGYNGVSNVAIGDTADSFGVRGYHWDIQTNPLEWDALWRLEKNNMPHSRLSRAGTLPSI